MKEKRIFTVRQRQEIRGKMGRGCLLLAERHRNWVKMRFLDWKILGKYRKIQISDLNSLLITAVNRNLVLELLEIVYHRVQVRHMDVELFHRTGRLKIEIFCIF